MPAAPSTIALTTIPDGTQIIAATHRNNYSAIQTAVNALQAILADVQAKGDLLVATADDTIARLSVGADHTVLQADSAQSAGVKWGGAWSSYTPVWSGTGTSPVIGNGSISGSFARLGKLIVAHINITMGSTTTFGSAGWLVSLPVSVKPGTVITALVRLTDISAGEYFAAARTNSPNDVLLFFGGVVAGTPAALVTGTVPFTWANNDAVNIEVIYEAA